MGLPSNDQLHLDNNKEQIMKNRETLVLDAIAKKCSSSSFDIFRQMNKAITVADTSSSNASDTRKSQLAIKILSGGATNYSYKVFVKAKPELRVFAKLSFEFALWNPDRNAHYDLKRTENEFQIMQTFSMLRPEFVVTPLYCLDLVEEDQNMKLLITEWAKGDEQFANQFIDGTIDERIAPKLADACATLHSFENFDPDFNQELKTYFQRVIETINDLTIDACKTSEPKDRTQAFCRDLGEDLVMKIMNASVTNYHQRDCLVHSDFHVFNLLVEAKPSIRELENFGPNGGLTICDWEMAFVGPIGRDIGLAQSFPIGCMIAHAFGGNLAEAYNIECFLDSLWDNYSVALEKMGKTPNEMARIHRNIVGYCGWFMYIAFYILQAQVEFFPIESTSVAQLDEMIDSMGILGLKFIRFGFDRDYRSALVTTDELQSHYKALIKEEVDRAYQIHCQSKRPLRARRSSALRVSGRRFSDADMFFPNFEQMSSISLGSYDGSY